MKLYEMKSAHLLIFMLTSAKLTPKAETRLSGGVVGIKLSYAPCLLVRESQTFLLTSQ